MEYLLPLVFTAFGLTAASAQSNYTTPYTFTTLAGVAPGSTDGMGSAARFNAPAGVALDSLGNTYIADTNNNLIRKMTPTGVVTTLAGAPGVTGSIDGVGVKARFNMPVALVLDSNNNIYVADSGNFTIRKITPTGWVSTLAGQAGVPGQQNGKGKNALFENFSGIAIDVSGNLYVADSGLRKITTDGVVTSLNLSYMGMPLNPSWIGIAVDIQGNIYSSNIPDITLYKITPSGEVTSLIRPDQNFYLRELISLSVDTKNNVYATEPNLNTIIKITQAGIVSVVAGPKEIPGTTDGPIATALLRNR